MAIPLQYDVFAKDRASGTFARVGGSMSRMNGQSTVLGRSFSKMGSVIATAAKRASFAVAGLTVVGAAMGVKTAASLQQAQIGFETMLGSAKEATAFLGSLKTFAAKTPFELPGLITNARQLLGVGVAAKDVVPFLQDFGDAAGALGISQEGFSRAMLAMSQSISAGKIKLGDMNQLMNAGLPIWQILSDAIGKPVPEIQKMISKGELLTKDVLPRMQAVMAKDYGGAMAKQSQTLSGLWSTFMDTLNIGLAETIMPLLPVLQGAMPGAMEAMGGALQRMSLFIRLRALPALGEIATVVRADVLPQLGAFVDFIQNKVLPKAVALARAGRRTVGFLSEHQSVLAPLAVTLGTYVVAVSAVAKATQAWAAAQVLVNTAMLTNPYIAAGAAVVAIAGGMVYWSKTTGAAQDSFVSFGLVATRITQGIGTGLLFVVDKAMAAVRLLLVGLDAVSNPLQKFNNFETPFKKAARAIDGARDKLKTFGAKVDDLDNRVIRIHVGVQFISDESALPSGRSLRQIAEGTPSNTKGTPSSDIRPDDAIAKTMRGQAKARTKALVAGKKVGEALALGLEDSVPAVTAGGKKMADAATAGVNKMVEAANKMVDKAKAKFDEIKAAAESLRSSVSDSVMGFFSLQSEGNPFRGLTSMANKAVRFANALGRLSKQGVNPAVISMIAQAGPDVGLRAAEMLSTAGKGNRNRIDNAYGKISAAADRAAETVTSATYGNQVAVAKGQLDELRTIRKAVTRNHKANPLANGWAAT